MNLASDQGGEIARQARATQEALSFDRFQGWIIAAPLIITTFLAKFSTPTFSARGLGIGFPITLIVLTLGILAGRVRLSQSRAAFFAVMIGFFGIVHILRHEEFAATSMILLIVATALYTLEVPRLTSDGEASMKFFVDLSCLIAIFGIVQFIGQFVIGKKYAFPIENFTPAGFLITGYHYLNPLGYGSSILKSNGVFLLEPSFFSQLLALGIVVELSKGLRPLRLAILALGLVFSYSGTGLIVLLVALPAILIVQKRLDILAGLIALAVISLIFSSPLGLDPIIGRIGEFANPKTSGYQRFVGWIWLAQDSLGTDIWRGLFGFGAGQFRGITSQYNYQVAEMLHSKMIEEYGVVGFFSYIAFLGFCIFRAPLPFAVRLALFVLQFMNGAFSETTAGMTLSLALLNCMISGRGLADRKVTDRVTPANNLFRPT